jgi:hypothetical protein
MGKVEKINDFLYQQEAYENEVKVLKGRVIRVNAGSIDTPQARRNLRNGIGNGFGFVRVDGYPKDIFFHESRICSHLQLNSLANKEVGVIGIEETDRGYRADIIECQECSEPELWEIYQSGEIKGIPQYSYRCKNKSDISQYRIPDEVKTKVAELNEPYNSMNSKVSIWERTTSGGDYFDFWFFSTMGIPDKMEERDGNLVIHYNLFGEKVLIPQIVKKFRSELGLNTIPIENPSVSLNKSSDTPIETEKIESEFCIKEFPGIRFVESVAFTKDENGLARVTEYFEQLDEEVKERIFKIIRERKLTSEELAQKNFKDELIKKILYFYNPSYETVLNQLSIEKLIEKYSIKNAQLLALLEAGDTPIVGEGSYTEQVYEPLSPDEMRGGFYTTETTTYKYILVAPRLIASPRFGLHSIIDSLPYHGGDPVAEIDLYRREILNSLQNLRGKILKKFETIEIDEKIYGVTKEELYKEINKEYQLLVDKAIEEVDKEREKFLTLYKDILREMQETLEKIRTLTLELKDLQNTAKELQIPNSDVYFYFYTEEDLERRSNESRLLYLESIVKKIATLKSKISKKSSIGEEPKIVTPETQNTPEVAGPSRQEEKDRIRNEYINKLYEIISKILSKDFISKFKEIYESNKSYMDKRNIITKLIIHKVNELDYQDKVILESFINAKSNSKFLDYVFSLIQLEEDKKLNEEQEKIKQQEEVVNPEILTLEPNISSSSHEIFGDLPPALKPIANIILEIAQKEGLIKTQDLLFEYENSKDKEEEKSILIQILGEGDNLNTFLNFRPGYRNKIVNAVIDEIDFILNNE